MSRPRVYPFVHSDNQYRVVVGERGGESWVEIERMSGTDALGVERWIRTASDDDGWLNDAVCQIIDSRSETYRAALQHIADGNISPCIDFAQAVLDGMTLEDAHKAQTERWGKR